jgi:hypothetical protein
MHKKEDYRTFDDKKYDFMYKHRIKIILLSFMCSLSILIISLIVSNDGGLYIIILYPLAVIGFVIDLIFKNRNCVYISFSYPILMIILSIILFILGFFISV